MTRPFRRQHDRQLPLPGTVFTREYRGRTIAVTVLENGCDDEGTFYRSLRAVARAIALPTIPDRRRRRSGLFPISFSDRHLDCPVR